MENLAGIPEEGLENLRLTYLTNLTNIESLPKSLKSLEVSNELSPKWPPLVINERVKDLPVLKLYLPLERNDYNSFDYSKLDSLGLSAEGVLRFRGKIDFHQIFKQNDTLDIQFSQY